MDTVSKRAIAKIAKKLAESPATRGGDGFAPVKAIRHSPPRKCIFCGGKPLTKEHIWPNWLRKHLPRNMPSYQALKAEVRDISASGKAMKLLGDIHHRKVKCVCAECNNGWMSSIEKAVEPIFSALLKGQQIRLTSEMQTFLAVWMTLKAIVAEYDEGSPRISRRAERQRLMMKRSAPLKGWRVLVGEYRGTSWPGKWVNTPLVIVDKITTGKERAVRKNSQSLTIVVGNVYLVLLRSQMEGLVTELRLGPAHDKLRQIWPPTGLSFRWPPPSLSDTEAIGISHFLLNFTLQITQRKRSGR